MNMLSRILENWRGLGSSDSRLSHGGLFFSLGLMIVGAGLQTVVVTLAGQHGGFSIQALGFIGSTYFVGYLAVGWVCILF